MTLFISNERYSHLIFNCLVTAVFIAAFGAVYEHFSFGVYSFYMIYAFAFFLVGGAVFWMLMAKLKKEFSSLFVCFWNAALTTFTTGFLVKGVLDIYGTSSPLINIFWIAGVLDIAAAFLAEALNWPDRKKSITVCDEKN